MTDALLVFILLAIIGLVIVLIALPSMMKKKK